MRISELAQRTGVSVHALRHYERLPAYRNGRLTFNDMVEAMQSRIAEIDAQVMALHSQRQQAVEHIAWLQDQARKQEAAAQAPKTAKAPWPTARKTTPATLRKTP
jgi:MerR family copper efflux transcriptional regulator